MPTHDTMCLVSKPLVKQDDSLVKTAPSLFDWLSLLALTALWGTSFLFNEIALRSFPPSVMVAGRLIIAALMLAMVLRYSDVLASQQRQNRWSLLIMALLGTILPFFLTAWAQQHIDSAITGILMAMMPLFVMSLAHTFIPGERVSLQRIIGFGCGFLGVVCVIGPDSLNTTGDNREILSIAAVLLAALSYAVNSIYTRRLKPGHPIVTAYRVMLLGAVIAIPPAALDASAVTIQPTFIAVVAIGVLGLLCTGLASVLYFRLVQGPGPIFLSLVNYLIPVWAVFAGALILDETLNRLAYVGLALILTGIAVSEFGRRVYRPSQRGRVTRDAVHTGTVATEDA